MYYDLRTGRTKTFQFQAAGSDRPLDDDEVQNWAHTLFAELTTHAVTIPHQLVEKLINFKIINYYEPPSKDEIKTHHAYITNIANELTKLVKLKIVKVGEYDLRTGPRRPEEGKFRAADSPEYNNAELAKVRDWVHKLFCELANQAVTILPPLIEKLTKLKIIDSYVPPITKLANELTKLGEFDWVNVGEYDLRTGLCRPEEDRAAGSPEYNDAELARVEEWVRKLIAELDNQAVKIPDLLIKELMELQIIDSYEPPSKAKIATVKITKLAKKLIKLVQFPPGLPILGSHMLYLRTGRAAGSQAGPLDDNAELARVREWVRKLLVKLKTQKTEIPEALREQLSEATNPNPGELSPPVPSARRRLATPWSNDRLIARMIRESERCIRSS